MAEMWFRSANKRDAVAKTFREQGIRVYAEGHSPFSGQYGFYYEED